VSDPGPTSSENKPRILLMGLRRSGKSSIQKVVFHKMSPNETLFLESTSKLIKNGTLGSLAIERSSMFISLGIEHVSLTLVRWH